MKSSDSSGGFYQDLAIRASSAAASLITPVVSWFGSWMSDSQPLHRRSTSSQVAESLLMEVIQQGRSLENQQNICRQMEMSTGRTVDYSWLVTEKRQVYDLSDVERLELEQLFCQVAPESYCRIIREFRSALLRKPAAGDLPFIMRAIVCRVIDEQRSTADASTSWSRWLTQSLTSLRSRFVETTPLVGSTYNTELSSNAVSSMELGGLSDSQV